MPTKSRVWRKPNKPFKGGFKPSVPQATESLKTPYGKRSAALAGINILIIIGVLLLTKHLPPEIPLFYGLAHGKQQLAPTNFLILPSLVSFFVVLINFLFSNITEDKFLRTTLIVASFVVTFFSIITTTKIILLIGSF